jgi:hypothetical protein
MSTVNCRLCNAANPTGSKFCNNCGAILPPATNLICPNCLTPNSRDLLYCDNCGSRLVKDAPLAANDPESEGPPVAAGNRAFSLPARQPGQTGELDINRIPQWLLAGQSKPAESDNADVDATPAKTEAVLGDWLDELTSLDEVSDSQATATDELFAGWRPQAPEPATPDRDVDESAANEFSQWLADLDQESKSETAAATTSPPAAESDDLAGWLADETFSTAADTEGLPDWLADDTPVTTADAGDLPDWLTDDTVISPTAVDAGDLPDWLTDDTATAPTAADAGDLPDWLTDDTVISPAAADAGDLPEWLTDDTVTAPTAADAGDLPDWLAADAFAEPATTADGLAGAEETPPAAFAADEPFPDWLTDDNLTESAGAELADWLTTEDDEPIIASATPAEEAPEWLPEDPFALTVTPEESQDFDDWFGDKPDSGASDQEVTGTGELPDWLVDMAPRGTGLLGPLPVEEQPDFFESGLDWLTEETAVEPAASDSAAATEADDDLPDWLLEASAADESIFQPLPADEEEEQEPQGGFDADDTDWLTLLTGATDFEADSDAHKADSSFFATDDTAVVGDWFDDKVSESWPEMDDLPELSPDDLSEDVAERGATGLESLGIPEELASSDLPGWLADTFTNDRLKAPSAAALSEDLPDWLQTASPEEDFDAALESALAAQPASPPASQNEWDDILGAPPATGELSLSLDLPPASDFAPPPTVALPDVELPAWLQALRPQELTDSAGEAEAEKPLETTGPLAGIRGALEVSPIVARPHAAATLPSLTVTRDQQQQILLLRHLTREEQKEAVLVAGSQATALPVGARLVLAFLLLLAVTAGYFLPGAGIDLGQAVTPPLAPSGRAVNQAVLAALGRPVLLVFDYTPALSGELDLQARMLLDQLRDLGMPVIITSQYAGGVALSRQMVADVEGLKWQELGFLPGEAIGVRRLGRCLGNGRGCDTLYGQPLTSELKDSLANVALVIVLTGEQQSLVNWAEQIGAQSDVPVVAAVPQMLAPQAAAYVTGGQLWGTIDGLPGAAAYERAFLGGDHPANNQLTAQALGQWLVIGLLLAGNLWYAFSALVVRLRRSRV